MPSPAIAYPDLIDDAGNIHVHSAGSLPLLPIEMQNDAGGIEDISSAALFFEVPSVQFSKALGAHPTNTRARGLSLTKADCASIPDGAAWILWDKSAGADFPIDLASGFFRKYGG